jgi:hypothetical protein
MSGDYALEICRVKQSDMFIPCLAYGLVCLRLPKAVRNASRWRVVGDAHHRLVNI